MEGLLVTGRIVILNGPSSVGKSSVATAFQHARDEPWVRIAFDDMLGWLPERLVNTAPSAAAGFHFIPGTSPTMPTRIVVGDAGQWAVRAFHRAVVAIARDGLDVIVDDVLLERAWLHDWLESTSGLDVLYVGLDAPIEVLDARELARGDRFPFLARGHAGLVHHEGRYDLTFDTSVHSVDTIVAGIAARLDSRPGDAFPLMRRSSSPEADGIGG